MDPVQELKIRAELLHTRLSEGNADALKRLRALPEMRRADEGALAEMAQSAQRKHCLAIVAREHGFSTWEHARRVIDGDPRETDLGSLLQGSPGVLNDWFVQYDEARAFFHGEERAGRRPYLLGFRRHFFVSGPTFIETLGLDPADADWAAIRWDWVRPKDPAARSRLLLARLKALRSQP
jgi:hypothetical protein